MLEELRVRVWLAVRGYGWRRDVRWVDVGERPCLMYTYPLSDDILWRLGERFKCSVYPEAESEEYYQLA